MVAHDADLLAALRPVVDPAMLQVTWASPRDLGQVLGQIVPWPWGLVGMGSWTADDGRLRTWPVLRWWVGPIPGESLPGVHAHTGWRPLAEDVASRLRRRVGGLTLAPNRGVHTSAGALILSPALEALVSAWPQPMALTSRAALTVTRLLVRHGATTCLVRENGGFLLQEGES